jgi:hypothetical protein
MSISLHTQVTGTIIMKNAIVTAVMSVIIGMIGCSKGPSSGSTPPPGTNAVAVSDGSNTWFMGVTRVDGTNVSVTNVTIRVRTPEASK